MNKLIEGLLGRPFMVPGDEGSGGGDGAGDGGGAAGAAKGGTDGRASGGGSGGGGGDGKSAATAAEIAARAGGAFAKNGGKGSDDKRAGGDDGVDPKTIPKAGANGHARPEHVPEKFWDTKTNAVKTEDLAKAYTTLESSFTALKAEKGVGKAGNAPDDYVKPDGWKVPDGEQFDRIRAIDVKTDPAMSAFRKVAHNHKIPVDAAAGLALDFLTEIMPQLPVPVTREDILKELGDGGEALSGELFTWLEGQFTNKNFSESELEWAFEKFGGSATGINVLAKVRELMGEKPIPRTPGVPAGDIPSKEEFYALNRDPRYKSDPAFREKVDALGEKIFGDDPAGTSDPGVGIPPPREVDRRERAVTRR